METVITDTQVLALIICAALSLAAYKCRMPPLALVPGIGFFILGYQIYDASGDALLLMLFFMVAVSQFILCYRLDGRR